MKKLLMTALFLTSSCAAGAAEDLIVDAAHHCWNLLPSGLQTDTTVSMLVTLSSGQVKDITVTSYSPETEAAYQTAASAARAVTACSPYGAKTGKFELMMDTKRQVSRTPTVHITPPEPNRDD